MRIKIKRALISVSNKDGIVPLATRLVANGVEIISTGGTFELLSSADIKVKKIDEYTGFPEILDGRLKTLHPKIHGGLLQVEDNPRHVTEALNNEILPIDLVVVNLYPFADIQTIENIDIGGPSMIRSAAKNYKYRAVVTDPADYDKIINETDLELRRELATKAFAVTAKYDKMIADWFAGKEMSVPFYEKTIALRYGENPHQSAYFLTNGGMEKLQGKELSYNNLLDTDSAYQLVSDFDPLLHGVIAIIKHNNPCGIAAKNSLLDAYKAALLADPKSAFGGVVAANRTIDRDLALEMKSMFFEVIVAPDFTTEAREVFSSKANLRLIQSPLIDCKKSVWQYRSVAGGLLVQASDISSQSDFVLVSNKEATSKQLEDLQFAFKVAKHVRSNAIVIAADSLAVGIGAGQVSRVDSVSLAIKKTSAVFSGEMSDLVLASDAFFPFADGLTMAAEYGISAFVAPKGSIRDAEVIAEANKQGVALFFAGERHFKH